MEKAEKRRQIVDSAYREDLPAISSGALQNNCLFSPDFIFTALAAFSNSFGLQMLVATLPVYVISSLGGNQAQAGLVSGSLAFTALLFRPFVGWLTDAWRRRPLILIGTFCYGFANVFYLMANSIPRLLLGRLVHGLGLSCYSTAANAYIADIAPFRRRAEAVGLFTAMQAMGLIIGPVAGFLIINRLGFRNLFYFSGGLAFMAFFISLIPRERRPASEIKKQTWSWRSGIIALDALPAAWMALCMGMGFGAVSAFISIFAGSRGIKNPGFFFMVQAVALIISRLFAGRLADRHGRAVVIVPGVSLMSAALILLPLAYRFDHFAVAASLLGLGFGAAQPASMALLIDSVSPDQRGLATSTYYTGFDVGISLGSLLFGLLAQVWGFGIMWPVAGICTLSGLGGFFIQADKRR